MSEYPTQEQLDAIAAWPADRLASWFDFIQEAGKYWPEDDYWTQEGNTYHISTAGWSGNEDILEAMSQNFACWALTWQSHRRGGHYIFEIPVASVPSAGETPQ